MSMESQNDQDLVQVSANVSSNLTWGYHPVDPYPGLRDLVHQVSLYTIPVIIVLGIVGNVFSLVVFLGTFMRRRSVSVYLAALAISDTVFLLTVCVIWLDHMDIRVLHTTVICQLTLYLSHCSSFLSVWFVVSFTVERYIAFCRPLKRPEMCTVGRARHVVVGLTIACLLGYAVVLFTSGIIQIPYIDQNGTYPYCGRLQPYVTVHMTLIYADTLVTLLLPFLSILVLNIKITQSIALFYYRNKQRHSDMMSLQHSRHTATPPRGSMSKTSSGESASSSRSAPAGGSSLRTLRPSYNLCSKAQLQTTKMLLLLSTLFMVINMPSYVMRLKLLIMTILKQQMPVKDQHFHTILHQIFQLIYYTNFAMNFFLYSVCSTKFRQAFLRFWRQMKRRLVSLCKLRLVTSCDVSCDCAHSRCYMLPFEFSCCGDQLTEDFLEQHRHHVTHHVTNHVNSPKQCERSHL